MDINDINILKQDLETLNPDAIVVCGPEIMYKVIKKTFADTNIPISSPDNISNDIKNLLKK